LLTPPRFVGLRNFERLFNDPRFWNAFVNTFGIFLISTIPQLLLALGLAHLLNHATLKMANFFRMALLVPYITSVAATALVFAQIFDKNFGLINWVLGLFGAPGVDFLSSQVGSWIVISSMVMWSGMPFFVILFLAGLKAIDKGQYEAASVDGAGAGERFWTIHLPGLKHVIIVTTLLTFIFTLNDFNIIYVMTRGGPANSTSLLITYIYAQAFQYSAFGYAAAMATLLVVVLMMATVLFFFITRGGRFQDD